MIIVSACLAGFSTRYDGGDRRDEVVARLVEKGEAIAVCPEELGGLGVPRSPSEISGAGDGSGVLDGQAVVVAGNGSDMTDGFLRGAFEVLKIARQHGVKQALLKDKSPSCGVDHIYKNGVLVPGRGVCAALLVRHGIQVTTRG